MTGPAILILEVLPGSKLRICLKALENMAIDLPLGACLDKGVET
jgi:hypothetical protein